MRIVPIAIVLALLLGIPAPSAADPINEPSRLESLVEGHTVFTTIEAYPRVDGQTTLAPHPAAAVAEDEPITAQQMRIKRFPGVLWFNDQYVTNPTQSARTGLGPGTLASSSYGASLAVLVRADDGRRVREPCGGAVLVVNAGDPDPRQLLVGLDGADPTSGDARERAVLRIDSQTPGVASDGALPFVDYLESYRITDPNSHTWIVDKYLGLTRVSLDGISTTYTYPIWVTNLLGTPAFVPDNDQTIATDGSFGPACTPFRDAIVELEQGPLDPPLCALALPNGHPRATGDDTDLAVDLVDGAPAWDDAPCMGAMEPSRAGYCYPGGFVEDVNGDLLLDRADCQVTQSYPARRYHALFQFRWEDLLVPGAPRDHADPYTTLDTTGCQSGTEWPCPGEAPWYGQGADDMEGNSHPGHPMVPPHEEAQPCLLLGSPNPVNHGGSLGGAAGVCDYAHATAAVEVYFSGSGRPPDPPVRTFRIEDAEGSSAPFFDHQGAYPGSYP